MKLSSPVTQAKGLRHESGWRVALMQKADRTVVLNPGGTVAWAFCTGCDSKPRSGSNYQLRATFYNAVRKKVVKLALALPARPAATTALPTPASQPPAAQGPPGSQVATAQAIPPTPPPPPLGEAMVVQGARSLVTKWLGPSSYVTQRLGKTASGNEFVQATGVPLRGAEAHLTVYPLAAVKDPSSRAAHIFVAKFEYQKTSLEQRLAWAGALAYTRARQHAASGKWHTTVAGFEVCVHTEQRLTDADVEFAKTFSCQGLKAQEIKPDEPIYNEQAASAIEAARNADLHPAQDAPDTRGLVVAASTGQTRNVWAAVCAALGVAFVKCDAMHCAVVAPRDKVVELVGTVFEGGEGGATYTVGTPAMYG